MFNARDAKVVIEAMQLDPKKFTVLVVTVPDDSPQYVATSVWEVMRRAIADFPGVRVVVKNASVTVEAFEHIPHG